MPETGKKSVPKYIISGEKGNIGSLLKKKLKNVSFYNENTYSSNADVFIHLASKSDDSAIKIVESNISYLLQVIHFCKRNSIKKFIFFSAMSIYNNTNKENVHEKDFYFNTNLYSTSKLLGENILEESTLEVLIIRLPMVLTRDHKNGVLNRIVEKLKKNQDVLLKNSHKLFNNFISIDDIYNFIIDYKFEKNFEKINLASKKENTLLEITEFLKKKLSSRSIIITSNEQCDFFNISIKKAKKLYKYKAIRNETKLSNWIKLRRK